MSPNRETRVLRVTRGYLPWLTYIATLPLLFPLALVLRLILISIKPLVHVRFGQLWVFNMGNHAMCTELYLCERDAGEHPKRSFDIFYHYIYEVLIRAMVRRDKTQNLAANKQLDIMFRRQLRVAQIARPLDKLNRLIAPGSAEFTVKGPPPYDQYGMLEKYPVHLIFTEDEEQQGEAALREMGIETRVPLCLFLCP